MKSLPLFLLVTLLPLAPLQLSAMIEEAKKSDESAKEGFSQERTQEYSKNQETKELIEERERANPALTTIGFLEERTLTSYSKPSTPENLQQFEKFEEDLTDPGILAQRLQEAREVVAKLQSKDPALSEAERQELFQQWSERQERSQETLKELETANNNAGLIEQQQNESRFEKLSQLVEASQTILENFQASLPQENIARSTSSDTYDPQTPKNLNWRDLLDEKKEWFRPHKDKAVFWSGWNGGVDPEICNLAKAKNYAAKNHKVTLETTEGGKRLGETYGWFDPSTHYREQEANAVWRYASEQYLKQASGHVISFILAKKHPKYNGASIYQTLERPILKNNETTFLSENITRPVTEDFLNKEQKAELNQPASQAILTQIHTWFSKVHAGWTLLVTREEFTPEREEFTPEHRQAFLDNPDLNLRGRMTETEKQEEVLSQLNETLLKDYILQAQALVEAWDPIYSAVRALDSYETLSDPKYIEEAKVEALQIKAALMRAQEIATVEGWKEESEWMREALHSLNYYIYKAYQKSGNRKAAREWQRQCLEQEVSIDEVPPLFLEAFLEKENAHNPQRISPTSITSLVRHQLHTTLGMKQGDQTSNEQLLIQQEERNLFSNLEQHLSKNLETTSEKALKEQTQLQNQLWQQRLENLAELHQTLEGDWAERKTAFETAYNEHSKRLQQKEAELQALDQKHRQYQQEQKELFLEGENLRQEIRSNANPFIVTTLGKSLEDNTQQLKELNKREAAFQEVYPEKRKTLEVSCQEVRKALWDMTKAHTAEEEEYKIHQLISFSRLKTADELLSAKTAFLPITEEIKELEELRELHKQTARGWEKLQEGTAAFLEKLRQRSIPTREEFKQTLVEIEAVAKEIESISKKDYQGSKALKGATAIKATARALRNWKEILSKIIDGNEFKTQKEIIEQARNQTADNLTKITSDGLEAVREELEMSAERTQQIATWSQQLKLSAPFPRTESGLPLMGEDPLINTVASNDLVAIQAEVTPPLSSVLTNLEERLKEEVSQSQEERFDNIEKILLEIRIYLFKKDKELFKEEKELEERRLALEAREKALEEEKKTLQKESLTYNIQPLLKNIEGQEENIELQKENAQQQEEIILKDQEAIVEQRYEIKKEEQKVTVLPSFENNPEHIAESLSLGEEEKKLSEEIIKSKEGQCDKRLKKIEEARALKNGIPSKSMKREEQILLQQREQAKKRKQEIVLHTQIALCQTLQQELKETKELLEKAVNESRAHFEAKKTVESENQERLNEIIGLLEKQKKETKELLEEAVKEFRVHFEAQQTVESETKERLNKVIGFLEKQETANQTAPLDPQRSEIIKTHQNRVGLNNQKIMTRFGIFALLASLFSGNAIHWMAPSWHNTHIEPLLCNRFPYSPNPEKVLQNSIPFLLGCSSKKKN